MKFLIADLEPDNVRNTQLYRTLLHEFGHYVHYLSIVERPAQVDDDLVLWEQRNEYYHNIPTAEKEDFAQRYALNLKRQLEDKRLIPLCRL